jgi:hypothetical protein
MSKDYSMKFKQMFGDLSSDDAIEIYSYDRVSSMFYNALMNSLINSHGYTEEEAVQFCQSKAPRFALDNKIGDMINKAAKSFAKTDALTWHNNCVKWVGEKKERELAKTVV